MDKQLREAVEAFIDIWDDGQYPHETRVYVPGALADAINILRALTASAPAAQEPVAWRYPDADSNGRWLLFDGAKRPIAGWEPLYAAPPEVCPHIRTSGTTSWCELAQSGDRWRIVRDQYGHDWTTPLEPQEAQSGDRADAERYRAALNEISTAYWDGEDYRARAFDALNPDFNDAARGEGKR